MQNPVTVSPQDDLQRYAACSTASLRCRRARRCPHRHGEQLRILNLASAQRSLCFADWHGFTASHNNADISKMFEPFPARAPLCVIRLRRPRKVYTIDCAICSLLEVIDAIQSHSQALEQEGKLCNMTSAAKKQKVCACCEVFVGDAEAVVPRRG